MTLYIIIGLFSFGYFMLKMLKDPTTTQQDRVTGFFIGIAVGVFWPIAILWAFYSGLTGRN